MYFPEVFKSNKYGVLLRVNAQLWLTKHLSLLLLQMLLHHISHCWSFFRCTNVSHCLQIYIVHVGIHIVVQMGLTALSLICSVLVLRLVSTDNQDVPPCLKKVSLFCCIPYHTVWKWASVCLYIPCCFLLLQSRVYAQFSFFISDTIISNFYMKLYYGMPNEMLIEMTYASTLPSFSSVLPNFRSALPNFSSCLPNFSSMVASLSSVVAKLHSVVAKLSYTPSSLSFTVSFWVVGLLLKLISDSYS